MGVIGLGLVKFDYLTLHSYVVLGPTMMNKRNPILTQKELNPIMIGIILTKRKKEGKKTNAKEAYFASNFLKLILPFFLVNKKRVMFI